MLVASARGPESDGLTSSAAPAPVRFGRDIRGILSDRCFQCHGPDSAKRQAALRLDERESAVGARSDGPAAIVPGHPDESELWRRITNTDPEEVMPPASANKRPLSEEEKELIRRWIAEGAAYEPHWAFVAPARPEVPAVESPDWCLNEIDRFVLSAMERAGVTPSPAADRATLLRRLFFDLTGLPPTPEELDAFLADESPGAYERWVDRLFAEEPYRSRIAERLTGPWLDAARYGDTCGIHMDNGRQMWAWRDWVLAAFRDNMPYDRFLTEQLAGDLLPDATVAQKVATGFNRNHVTSDEGGAIAEEYLVEYAVDRVSTTSGVFLGLTTGCARCHDHKYDPISQEDFYGLFAFFNSIEEPGLYSQTQDSKRAYEPFLEVPTAEQTQELSRLAGEIAALDDRMRQPLEGEDQGRAEFVRIATESGGITWTVPDVLSASSTDPSVTLTPLPDHSIQASGPIPDVEDYVISLRTSANAQRLLLLEGLATPGAGPGAGRASHGNAVVTGVKLEGRAAGTDGEWSRVPLRWAWADYTQTDLDYEATNVIEADDAAGWAFYGNERAGSRLLLMITDRDFGENSGTELRVTLSFRSRYTQHSLGHVRLRVGTANEAALASLPVSPGRWYVAGPFQADAAATYDNAFGPENEPTLDQSKTFGPEKLTWRFDGNLADGRPVTVGNGVNTFYIGRTIWSPSPRELDVSLGSDDGFRLYVNGSEVASRKVDRSLAPDQDNARVPLAAGANTVVLKIANTGGEAGYYYRPTEPAGVLEGDLVQATIPPEALSEEQAARFRSAYRRTNFPEYRNLEQARTALEKSAGDLRAAVPRTMVMREMEKPRETFVLSRGVYDKPDRTRPVARGIPRALGSLPEGAPPNRLGLAHWMTDSQNPLTARVAVNRFWEMVFGTGIVRTSENFGLQGEWPSHPELLDWLAVDFREGGWDVQRLLKAMVLSSTYRQSSRVREELRSLDADNRLLAYYPRRRLTAEQIRDQALYVSGLLVERMGGPSVKPYQPDGLWQETAMPSSNTRVFERGKGEDLWRRTIYTYWKRASPPPALLMLDAPTRESCVIRRPITNTPLQALALWNDEQYVEAARKLAERTLTARADDEARLKELFRRCTSRAPEGEDLAALLAALDGFRTRFASAPDDAEKLLGSGEAPRSMSVDARELAAWTMMAGAVLNLHETLTQD
ncbi:hypothetical protein PHYC_03511 [Phycisphaerales bacterium]|nr:hypothetical protein PHYC_03511 [Phycisphaerales bacterium]